jgi:hypothetical protein
MDQFEQAIQELNQGIHKTISAAAIANGLNRTTLSRRFKGVQESASHKAQNQQLLTPPQEQRLILHIKSLSRRGLHPTPAIVRNLAQEICGTEPGRNWSHRFVHRHSKVLGSDYCERLDRQRFKADYKQSYIEYFELLQEKVTKYNIRPCNTYNMDEKGFLIGWASKQHRIFSKQSNISKSVLSDENREWITMIGCVCADGTALPPGIIFAGASGHLQTTWVKDVVSTTRAFFAATPNGWTNDETALDWMRTIFDPITKPKALREKRLLILDGHGSHVNMKFINWCSNNGIIIACYPPHTTHRLQPLDVSLFLPLATRYSQQLERWNQQSLGISKVSKRDFYYLFEPAFEQSFTAVNIHSAFAKTGIYPLNSEVVVSKLPSAPSTRPTTANSSDKDNPHKKVKKEVRFLDEFTRKVKKEPQFDQDEIELHMVKESLQSLAAENKLQAAKINGLESALYHEQNKRKKGKTITGEMRAKNKSGSLWWTPSGIKQAEAIIKARAAAKQAETDAKQAQKAAKALDKQQQAIAKQQALLERQDQQQKKAAKQANQKTLRQRLQEVQLANKQLLNDIHTAAKSPRKLQKDKQPLVMDISSPVPPKLAELSDLVTTRSGRISQPSRSRRAP